MGLGLSTQLQRQVGIQIAKLIIFGLNRDDCLKKAGHALSRFGCEGIESTIDFHKMIIEHFAFQKSKIHTRWIDNEMRLT